MRFIDNATVEMELSGMLHDYTVLTWHECDEIARKMTASDVVSDLIDQAWRYRDLRS